MSAWDDALASHERILATLTDEWVAAEVIDVDGDLSLRWARASGYTGFLSFENPYSDFDWDASTRRIVRLLDTKREWLPLPDGPTEEYIGATVRQVLEGREQTFALHIIRQGQVHHRSFGFGWRVDVGEWSVDAATIKAPLDPRVKALMDTLGVDAGQAREALAALDEVSDRG